MKKKYLLKLAQEKGWNWISEHQKLSEDLIREFQDKLNWEILKGRKLSKTIKMGFAERLG